MFPYLVFQFKSLWSMHSGLVLKEQPKTALQLPYLLNETQKLSLIILQPSLSPLSPSLHLSLPKQWVELITKNGSSSVGMKSSGCLARATLRRSTKRRIWKRTKTSPSRCWTRRKSSRTVSRHNWSERSRSSGVSDTRTSCNCTRSWQQNQRYTLSWSSSKEASCLIRSPRDGCRRTWRGSTFNSWYPRWRSVMHEVCTTETSSRRTCLWMKMETLRFVLMV